MLSKQKTSNNRAYNLSIATNMSPSPFNLHWCKRFHISLLSKFSAGTSGPSKITMVARHRVIIYHSICRSCLSFFLSCFSLPFSESVFIYAHQCGWKIQWNTFCVIIIKHPDLDDIFFLTFSMKIFFCLLTSVCFLIRILLSSVIDEFFWSNTFWQYIINHHQPPTTHHHRLYSILSEIYLGMNCFNCFSRNNLENNFSRKPVCALT